MRVDLDLHEVVRVREANDCTIVDTGRTSSKSSLWARPIRSMWAMSTTNMRVRTVTAS